MFTYDFCSCIHFSKFHFYADHLQIYLSRWSAENGLLLNLRKAILILNSAVGMVLSSLLLGTEEMPWCDAVNALGVVIDGRIRFDR
jgi:hypothetical protein